MKMELVKVYTAAGELDAEMVKGFLEAQGIKVMLVQESIGRTLWIDRWYAGRGQTPGPKMSKPKKRKSC